MNDLILNPKNIEKYVCDGCKYFDKYKFGYNKGLVRKNCFCKHPSLDGRMTLVQDADPDTPCIMPPNCPMKSERIELLEKPSWDKLEPLTPWDDIKLREIYYIPPINGGKIRWTVEVTYKNDSYLTCKVIDTTSTTDSYLQYKSFYRYRDKEANFFVQKIL